ncbi:PAS domain-containing protein [Variovorax sp. J22P271]|uniref:PAS domain-containing protein n=1 Tax=Variovorax davisae TaxID=3053515 RepID=UPI00257816EE|nr:PAS domain-containing protein [Variovorax sp. J22P271]MDM0036791.1 PAS domain-containing protein [Variovorax sp. J22P271]
MGALMRSHDWSDSPLGQPEQWPQALRTVVDLLLQSQFPMFVAWGEELGFIYNDSYAEILGAKHPRALGRRFKDIWTEIWTDIAPLIDAAMSGNASFHEDLPLVMNRKGYDEQTWFTFSYSPVHDDSGKVAGMFCAVCESTGRVLAERALRELNETLERRVSASLAERKLLADIVEGMNAFVQVADLEYRWLAINQAAANEFERIFGVRPRVGSSMLELLASQPEHQAAVRAVWSRALAGEEFVEIAEFGDPDRDRRSYEMRYNILLGADGQQIGAYQFVYDVTERVRDQERLRLAQDMLRQSQKMESLGQLTGGVAHDFNNLLAVFANGLQVLERDVSAEQRQRVYASLRRAVARGSGLTRQLLSFSRRRTPNLETIDLAAHLALTRDLVTRSLRGDIAVEMELAPDLWPVEVDAGELELAILNLCVNARDAMPVGGAIRITANNVSEVGEDGGFANFVRLSVEDKGCGMSPEVQSHVFEPFFTTKDVGKGSGLGLPQVYGFVQQSGGRLTLDSRVGVGTVVTLLLPRSLQRPVVAVDAASGADPRKALGRGHVLLVEDDVEVAALTREMLSELGFTILHAASSTAALGALANARDIDIVLADLMLPGGMGGLELVREIRRRRPGLPIVLTTGNPEATAGPGSGEFALLLKPYTLDELWGALSVR